MPVSKLLGIGYFEHYISNKALILCSKYPVHYTHRCYVCKRIT
jgi:hypothetical protein